MDTPHKRILVTVGAEKQETVDHFMTLVEAAIEKVFDDYEGEPVVMTMLPRFACQHSDPSAEDSPKET